MKVEVNEIKDVNDIDWDKPQLLVSIIGSLVYTNGCHSGGVFEGVDLRTGSFIKDWIKHSFEVFSGSVTLEND